VLLASGTRRLIAFANPEVPGTEDLPPWRETEHEVHRWCRLLEGCGIPADPSRLDLDPPPLQPPAAAVGATVVHPGAAFPARRWPAERWARVVRHELEAGRRVVVTGSLGEAAVAREVARRAGGLPDEAVLAGRTGLAELAAVVAAASRVASADTGIAHLATALRTPSVVLFGPDPPARWGPPPARPWHRALWTGHRGDPRGQRPDPGLLAVSVPDVVAALESLPEPPPRPAAATAATTAVPGPATNVVRSTGS
jgi:ADP-heptose:LPS heptosyltransferase